MLFSVSDLNNKRTKGRVSNQSIEFLKEYFDWFDENGLWYVDAEKPHTIQFESTNGDVVTAHFYPHGVKLDTEVKASDTVVTSANGEYVVKQDHMYKPGNLCPNIDWDQITASGSELPTVDVPVFTDLGLTDKAVTVIGNRKFEVHYTQQDKPFTHGSLAMCVVRLKKWFEDNGAVFAEPVVKNHDIVSCKVVY